MIIGYVTDFLLLSFQATLTANIFQNNVKSAFTSGVNNTVFIRLGSTAEGFGSTKAAGSKLKYPSPLLPSQ